MYNNIVCPFRRFKYCKAGNSQNTIRVQSPKILKMHGFRKLYSCFVVVFRSFPQNFPLVAPDNAFKHTQNSKMICRGYFARYLKSPRRLEISPKKRGKHIGAIKAHSLLF